MVTSREILKMKKLSVSIHSVNFGKNVRVVEPSKINGCSLGDDGFIGPFAEIQKDVTIEHVPRCNHIALFASWHRR